MSNTNPSLGALQTITPHLICAGAKNAIEFYRRAFGAELLTQMEGPDGRVLHSALKIGNSQFYVVDAYPEWGSTDPQTLGGSPVTIHLYVPDVDAVFQRAVDAGAKVLMELQDTFWGDRYGKLADPFGHEWSLATPIKQMSKDEIEAAAKKMFGGQSNG
ncbi:MAG: VOC family protein [Gemmatimonadetes bacterium]|nr:MAG: VOC family protein [Gemmatimonadota bacterium]